MANDSISTKEEKNNEPLTKDKKVQNRATNKKYAKLSLGELLLRDSNEIYERIVNQDDLSDIMIYFSAWGVVFGALYGVCLGFYTGILQMMAGAFKIPLLFFTPLIMCSPSLFTFNVLLGTQMSYKQIIAILLIMTYMSTIVLSSFAPIMFFFILTGGSYRFTHLLNVCICSLAGFTGVAYLFRGIHYLTKDTEGKSHWLRFFWLIIYMFVGSQLAWGLRPFIGNSFAWYRPVDGNVYTSMYHIVFDSWFGPTGANTQYY